MIGLLENLRAEQTKDIQYFRKEKWTDREGATKIYVLPMCQILIDKFKNGDTGSNATAVNVKYTGNKGTRHHNGKKCKEDHPPWAPRTAMTTATRTLTPVCTQKALKIRTTGSPSERQDG